MQLVETAHGRLFPVNPGGAEIGTRARRDGLDHYAAFAALRDDTGQAPGFAYAVLSAGGAVLAWDGWYFLGDELPEPPVIDWSITASAVTDQPNPRAALHRFNAAYLDTTFGFRAYAEFGSVDLAVAALVSSHGTAYEWPLFQPGLDRLAQATVLAYAPATCSDQARAALSDTPHPEVAWMLGWTGDLPG